MIDDDGKPRGLFHVYLVGFCLVMLFSVLLPLALHNRAIAALIHLTDMRAFVETAFDHMDIGDSDMRDGDALPDPPTMPKVMAYMSAKSHYNAAKQTADMAIAEHQIIVSQLEIANGILVLYG